MLPINMLFVNVGSMLQINSHMPTHCSNVGAMLPINMLFVNVGSMLQLNSDMPTRCSNVGTMLQVNMLSVICQCWPNVAIKQ